MCINGEVDDGSLHAAALIHCKLCRIERGDGDIEAKEAVWNGNDLTLTFEDGDVIIIKDAHTKGFSVEG